MVIFGPSVWSSGQKYSAVRFFFIRPSGFGLMDPFQLVRYQISVLQVKCTECSTTIDGTFPDSTPPGLNRTSSSLSICPSRSEGSGSEELA